MAAPRANWKGYLKIGELSCPVALYTAASTSERVTFHVINRKTGNRVQRQFVDPQTGKPVPPEDQVKGYEVDKDRFVILEPDEIAEAVPDADKTLAVSGFIPCGEVDTVYFDRPYYLAPSDHAGEEAFVVIREALKAKSVAALARTVLFRRVRSVMIRPHGRGLVANTLNYDYEVRSAKAAFEDLADIKIEPEMLDLAKHIIETKRGTFDPAAFDDRYEAAVADLVRLKIEGKAIPKRGKAAPAKVIDLMEALRASAGGGGGKAKGAGKGTAKAAAKKAAAGTTKTPAKASANASAKTTAKPRKARGAASRGKAAARGRNAA